MKIAQNCFCLSFDVLQMVPNENYCLRKEKATEGTETSAIEMIFPTAISV